MRVGWIMTVVFVASLFAGCPCPCKPLKAGMVVSLPVSESVFSANAWAGLERAHDELGVAGALWENDVFEDFAPGIDHFVNEGYDMVLSVGFYSADYAQATAALHPDMKFVCVDHAYGGGTPNLAGADFATGQAAYLAGYLAAGMTKTGTTGVMGGMNIPPVVAFMQGFADGVIHYNDVKGTSVQVIGLDTFLGSFDDPALAHAAAETQLAAGADILLPAAGDAALGAADAILEAGDAWIVGVDTDMYLSSPEYGSIVLTSILKNLDAAVFARVKQVHDGTFDGSDYVGTLANGGVGLAPFHDLGAEVPESLKAELDALARSSWE